MNHPTKRYASFALLFLILFTSGKLLFSVLFGFFEPSVDGILFQIIERDRLIKTSTMFSLTLVFIFVLSLLLWRLAPIISLNKKLASVITILIFITFTVFIRHQEVKAYFTDLVKNKNLLKGKAIMLYPIDPLNFVYYMVGGLITGCIVSFFLFREKKKNNT